MKEKQKLGTDLNSATFLQNGPILPYSFDMNVLFCGYEQCDPFHYAGPCYKKGYLLHIVLNGKGIFKINNKVYHLKKGDMFLIKPKDYIYYEADGNDPWEYKWIKFDGAAVSYLLENAEITQNIFTNLTEEQIDTINNYFDKIFNYMSDEVASYIRATGMFYIMMGWFINEFGNNNQQNSNKMSFMKIVKFIQQNYTADLTMDVIEKKTNYNRTHIYKLFMKNLQYSPKEYINELRLNLASELLIETNEQIKVIAKKVGFKSYISFVKAFTNKYNRPPSHYRNYKIHKFTKEEK